MIYTKLSIVFKSEQKPPFFIGSQLRGAFGYALKRVSCINPSFKCDGCFATTNCLFYDFYEAKSVYRKYRFDFELGKELYDFSFYLFDDVCEKLPYIVSAFNLMLTKYGLGKDRKKYENFNMFINGKSCIEDDNIRLPKDFIKEFKPTKYHPNILIKFKTPLRIKRNNRFIRDDSLSLKDIINSIYHRKLRLTSKELQKYPYEIKGEVVKKELYYQELMRLSNRQKTKMKLGGLMGEMQIENIDEKSYEFLKLGEIIGSGKSTVFGLGKIEVEEV